MIIKESELRNMIRKSIMEKTFLKLNNGGSQQPPMPPMDTSMGGMPPMGGDPNMMGDAPSPMDGGMGDGSNMDGMPPQNDGQSEFDTNFDAGVEADEDTDPKKFIQQLTGKLSQSLNSYNNEQGQPDAELCKYVGKMILKQAAKGLDDAGKKELIKAINTADTAPDDNGEEEMPDDTGSEEMPMDDGGQGDMEQMPMNEISFTKGEYKKILKEFGIMGNEREEPKQNMNPKRNIKSPFAGKRY